MSDVNDPDKLKDETKFCGNVSVASSAGVDTNETGKCGKANDQQRKHRYVNANIVDFIC